MLSHQSVCLHDPVSHYFNVYLLIDRESLLFITHFLVISECLLFQLNLRIMLEIPSKIPLRTFWKWMKSEPETDTALGLLSLSPPPSLSFLHYLWASHFSFCFSRNSPWLSWSHYILFSLQTLLSTGFVSYHFSVVFSKISAYILVPGHRSLVSCEIFSLYQMPS